MSNRRKFRRSVARGSVVFVLPEIPEDAPARVREGIARRRLVATTGRCPCGAEFRVPNELTPGTLTMVAVEHEADCPATDDAIEEVSNG